MGIYKHPIIRLGANANDPALPALSGFLRYVPEDDLLDFWTAQAGLDLSDAAPVVSWTGVKGTVAAQADAAKRPVFDVDGVASGYPAVVGDGSDDILQTSIVPPAQGVLGIAFKTPASLSGVKVLMGSYGGSATSALAIGFNGTELAAQVGDQNFTTLKGGALAADTSYVATLSWDDANCYLRLDGDQVASAAWGGSLGTAVLGLLGRNAGSPNYNTLARLGSAGIYDAFKSGVGMSDIENGLAKSIGVVI
ncbi:hypothetical protein [Spongiibacter tropicus]|uniref:hypothetical protein n=1 Tax=Spongiibacter tropicus TaxID=454602 RepID=UPI0003B318EB|nr:hypothetical protein [Spongiibacter tropicus]